MSTLTPWFSGDVQPVHLGVYQLDCGDWGHLVYCYWSRRGWGWPAIRPEIAVRRDWLTTRISTRGKWRGLAEKAT